MIFYENESTVMRNKVTIKAPVYTTPLIVIAVNIAIISFLFTINDVNVPIKPATNWALQKIYEVGNCAIARMIR